MVKCAALGAVLRCMGGRDLAQARRYTSGRADLSLGSGQQENVGEGIDNEAEPKPSRWTVASVQGAVRADGAKNESQQEVKTTVNPRAGCLLLIVAGAIRHAGLVRVGAKESPSQGLQPHQIPSRMRKEFRFLPRMHRDPLSLHEINRVVRPHRIVADDTSFPWAGADPGPHDLSVARCSVRRLCEPAAARTLWCLFSRTQARQGRLHTPDH